MSMNTNPNKFTSRPKKFLANKPKSACECRRPGCKGCSKPTESKARKVVATLIGESNFEPEDDLPVSDIDREPHSPELDDEPQMSHDEEERTEVVIANEILAAVDNEDEDVESRLETVRTLGYELLELHGEDGVEDGVDDDVAGPTAGDQDSLEDFEADLGLDEK